MSIPVLDPVIVEGDRPAVPARSLTERAPTTEGALRAAMDGFRADIQTALPGIVESFDPETLTCRVRPAIKCRVLQGAKWISAELPMLLDVPVQFFGCGGYVITSPLAQGDEVLVVFASRCIDSWWQNGGIQEPAAIRFHSLSDGFAIPGIRSLPRALDNFYADGIEIRNEAGTRYIRATDAGWTIKGTVTVEGDVVADGISLKTHTHGGVQSGSSNTGAPN